MNGHKLSYKPIIYATALGSFLAIFCVFQLSTSNTIPLFLASNADADSVDHGCYRLHSVSDQTEMDKERLTLRMCNKTYPDVIIAGAKKSGTTALKNFLKFHPQLATSNTETHFFDNKYHLGTDWYLEQMPYSTPQQITMEKTPKYFVHPLSPSAIQKHLGTKTKLIFILRDPVQRAISDFAHVYTYNAQRLLDGGSKGSTTKYNMDNLENPLTKEQVTILKMVKRLERHGTKPSSIKDTFEESVLFPNGTVNAETSIIDTGIYIKHLRRWLDIFPREQILILDGEEFVYNPLPALQKVERFLELQPYFKDDHFYFDSVKSFFCMAHPIRSCMRSCKGRSHPFVKYDVKQTLYDFFEPYNIELGYVLNQNFTWIF